MTSLQNTIKQVKTNTKELVSDLWFFMNLTPSSYVALHKVIKRCRYIKTPNDYLAMKWDLSRDVPDSEKDCPTPLREEFFWWQMALKGICIV